jgi:hypothetical protein
VGRLLQSDPPWLFSSWRLTPIWPTARRAAWTPTGLSWYRRRAGRPASVGSNSPSALISLASFVALVSQQRNGVLEALP